VTIRILMAGLGLMLLCPVSPATAQSTQSLPGAERSVRLEFSVGAQVLDFSSWSDAGAKDAGTVTAALTSVRWHTPGSLAGLRLSGWWIGRGSSTRNGQYMPSVSLAGMAVYGDVPFRISRDLTIGPSFGLGFAPMVHSGTGNGSGVVTTAGLGVRFGRVVVEQYFFGFQGAESVVRQYREYYPLTIGMRF
jgi:hypothetical protein